MSPNQPSWRHHYIPEFYLKRWALTCGQLVEFSKPFGDVVKPKLVAPRRTGWHRRLYSLDGLPEDRAHLPELEYFSPVDSRAADVLTKMERGIVEFSEQERVAWAQFILSLAFRNPENVQAMKSELLQRLSDTTRADERRWQAVRGPDNPRSMREAFLHPDSQASVNRLAMRTFMSSISSEKIGNHLINMKWGSRRLPFTASAMLTSDRPLQWFGSLDHKDCHLLLPIGPKQVFWACNSADMVASIQCQQPGVLVRLMNEWVVGRAVKYAYGVSDGHLSYVQANMGTSKEITIVEQVINLRAKRRSSGRKGKWA